MPPMEVLLAIEHANFPLVVEGAHEIRLAAHSEGGGVGAVTFRQHSHGGGSIDANELAPRASNSNWPSGWLSNGILAIGIYAGTNAGVLRVAKQ